MTYGPGALAVPVLNWGQPIRAAAFSSPGRAAECVFDLFATDVGMNRHSGQKIITVSAWGRFGSFGDLHGF